MNAAVAVSIGQPHNHRMNPPASGGLVVNSRRRSPAAGYAERWADEARLGHRCRGTLCTIRARERRTMRTFNVIVERDPETGLYVGHVPGWPGAHSQGATLDELEQNLREVITMLLEDGDPKLESEFIGLQSIRVA